MKNRLIELLEKASIGRGELTLKRLLTEKSLEQIADYLLENGVLAPPIKIGAPVYAFMSPFTGFVDEPEIEEWEVKGVAYDGKSWSAMNVDKEFFDVGDDFCLLTREEAESRLEESKRT